MVSISGGEGPRRNGWFPTPPPISPLPISNHDGAFPCSRGTRPTERTNCSSRAVCVRTVLGERTLTLGFSGVSAPGHFPALESDQVESEADSKHFQSVPCKISCTQPPIGVAPHAGRNPPTLRPTLPISDSSSQNSRSQMSFDQF